MLIRLGMIRKQRTVSACHTPTWYQSLAVGLGDGIPRHGKRHVSHAHFHAAQIDRMVCNTDYKSNPCWSTVPRSWWTCNGHSPSPHSAFLSPPGGSSWKTGGLDDPVWTRRSWTLADEGVSQTFPGRLAQLARGVPLPLTHTKSVLCRSTVPRCRTVVADLERDCGLGGDAISCRRSDIGPDTFHLPNPWAGTWCLNRVSYFL